MDREESGFSQFIVIVMISQPDIVIDGRFTTILQSIFFFVFFI